MGYVGIPDLDHYGEQCPSVVIFEPGTLNLEPISLGIIKCIRYVWVGVIITIFIFESKNLLLQLRILDCRIRVSGVRTKRFLIEVRYQKRASSYQ
jgi:hypothetical protein